MCGRTMPEPRRPQLPPGPVSVVPTLRPPSVLPHSWTPSIDQLSGTTPPVRPGFARLPARPGRPYHICTVFPLPRKGPRVKLLLVLAAVATVSAFFAQKAAAADGKRPMTLDDLFKLKRVADPQISPDGKLVA